jgi:transposase
MTTVERGLVLHRYWDRASCQACALNPQCTPSVERRITLWEHEAAIEAMQRRMDLAPQSPMKLRRRIVEHPFGTIKAWMASTHFLMKRLENVKIQISLHILAYNLKRVIQILGTGSLIAAIRA